MKTSTEGLFILLKFQKTALNFRFTVKKNLKVIEGEDLHHIDVNYCP